MAQKIISGNKELGLKIKTRRNELGLTIEEAALRAGVGTKTWSRYESGESIRKDKCKGICKALNWHNFPDSGDEQEEKSIVDEYKEHKAWSQFLANNYGIRAATAFAVGSDMLLDYIEQDLSDLAAMPSGSHIGQLSTSFIKDELPAQFMTRYTYDFLYHMRCTLIQLRSFAQMKSPLIAHSVIQELIILLCDEEANAFLEIMDGAYTIDNSDEWNDSKNWIFDLFGDMDIISCLYSDCYLDKDHPYHFDNWNSQIFYVK